jgi:hypothetical protein
MRCGFCNREFDPAKWNQRFCKLKCKDDFHNREKLEARREAEHDRVRVAERAREDRINGTITLDLIPVPEDEPRLVVKRRKILTVEAGR